MVRVLEQHVPVAAPTALEYLRIMHDAVRNNYTKPNGNRYCCNDLALDLAGLLIDEGCKPVIVTIDGGIIDGHEGSLVPLRFPTMQGWFAHYVCSCDGLMYEPVLGEAVSVAQYGKKMFGRYVEMYGTTAEETARNVLQHRVLRS